LIDLPDGLELRAACSRVSKIADLSMIGAYNWPKGIKFQYHWMTEVAQLLATVKRQLKARGFSVYIVPGGSGTSLRYRVRIGPMADRGTATQTLAKLKSAGQAGSLVAPAP